MIQIRLYISYKHGHDSCRGLSPLVNIAHNSDSEHGKTDMSKGGEQYENKTYNMVITCNSSPLLDFRSKTENLSGLLKESKYMLDQLELELCQNIAITLNKPMIFSQLMDRLFDVEKLIKEPVSVNKKPSTIENRGSFSHFSISKNEYDKVVSDSEIAKPCWTIIDKNLTDPAAFKNLHKTVFASDYWLNLTKDKVTKILHDKLGSKNILQGVTKFEEGDSQVFKNGSVPCAFGKDFFECLSKKEDDNNTFKYVYSYILECIDYVKKETSGRVQLFLLYTMFQAMLDNCKESENQAVKDLLGNVYYKDIVPVFIKLQDQFKLELPFLKAWKSTVPETSSNDYLKFESQSEHNFTGHIKQNFSNNNY